MNKRVAVIGGRPAPIHGARDLGIDVVLVHQPGQYEAEIAEHCERVVHADITDGKAIVSALEPLHADRPFDRIVTTTEVAGESSGFAVDHFGLPGVGEFTARVLKDKMAMRALLAESGVDLVACATVTGASEAAAFVAEHGTSVLKPIDGVASLHIHPCQTSADAEAAWERLSEAGVSRVMAEKYLEGPVVSVDSFSFEGRHVPIGYSEYRMNDRYVEWEVSTPSDEAARWLPELRELVVRLLDAVGLTEGPSHSEFILTSEGPHVLESHARLAGSGAPQLVRRAFGYDLDRMFLTVPLGIDELPASSPDPIAGAAVQFFVPEPGVVESVAIDVPAEVRVRELEPGTVPLVFLPFLQELWDASSAVVVQKGKGDVVPPLLTVADCVSGYAITTGSSRRDAVAKVDELVSQVRFTVRPE